MERELRLAETSKRQFGAFSGRQAVDVGFSRSTIGRRVRSGAWERLVGDTYRIRAAATAWEQPLVAAWLAVGLPGAISHLSAAAMWGLGLQPGPLAQVTVPLPRHPRPAGVEVVRTTRWGRLHVVRMGILRVTSVHRTLLDIVPLVPEVQLEQALDAAHRKGLVDLGRLDRYLAVAHGQRIPGARLLRNLVSLRDPASPIESPLETLLFAVLRLFAVPLPDPQHWVVTRNGRRRIDFAYVEERIALEVDGYEGRDRFRFDDDRARDNELADLGWERRHITWTMLNETPAEAAWTVATALGLEPSRWRPRGSRVAISGQR